MSAAPQFSQGQTIPVWEKGLQIRIDASGLRELLLHLEANGGFDDLYLMAGMPVKIKGGGRIQTIVPRPLDEAEAEAIINAIYDDNGATEIYRGVDIDTSYEIRPDRRTRYRYRVAAIGRRSSRAASVVSLVLRSIKATPVPIERLGIEMELVEAMFPKQGLVIVAGETGSGKSTLLSSAIRHFVESNVRPSVILTYEHPIEYVYDDIEWGENIIEQTEVGRHIATFAGGIRNALRSSPEIILVGEMRDAETIEAGIRASMTGHLLLSTTHANSVVETVRRMANEFSGDMREARLREIVANLRLVIVQYLAPRPEGGRTPIREHFVFDQDARSELLALPPEDMLARLHEMVEARGDTMLACARDALANGLITREIHDFIAAGV